MKKMTRKQKKRLVVDAVKFTLIALGFIGFFLMIGSVGSYETDPQFTTAQYFIWGGVGLALMFISADVYNKLFEEE